MSTDPPGRTFISYSRASLESVERLASALHDVGIPTWRDIDDLRAVPTELELRRVLADDATSSAIVWITEDVQDSDIIRRLEIPAIIDRARRADPFFALGVAADGIDYSEAARVSNAHVIATTFAGWNLARTTRSPASHEEVRDIASTVLTQRLGAIGRTTSPGTPLCVSISTRDKPIYDNVILSIDWVRHFRREYPTPETWDSVLLPALARVSSCLKRRLPNRELMLVGDAHLPVATSLGMAFLAPRQMDVSWRQYLPHRTTETWNLAQDGATEYVDHVVDANSRGRDFALLVSVADNVEPAFAASISDMPAFCATVHLHPNSNEYPSALRGGQAANLARKVVATIRARTKEYACGGIVHLFMAAPVGLAFLVGQLANTIGPIQTYEHVADTAIGHYEKAVLLNADRRPS